MYIAKSKFLAALGMTGLSFGMIAILTPRALHFQWSGC